MGDDNVARLAERASTKFGWNVPATRLRLSLLTSDRGEEISGGASFENKEGRLLSSGPLKLAAEQVTDGSYLLALVTPPVPAPAAAASSSSSSQAAVSGSDVQLRFEALLSAVGITVDDRVMSIISRSSICRPASLCSGQLKTL